MVKYMLVQIKMQCLYDHVLIDSFTCLTILLTSLQFMFSELRILLLKWRKGIDENKLTKKIWKRGFLLSSINVIMKNSSQLFFCHVLYLCPFNGRQWIDGLLFFILFCAMDDKCRKHTNYQLSEKLMWSRLSYQIISFCNRLKVWIISGVGSRK